MRTSLWLERYGGSKPIIVYHGTSINNLPSILSQGLIPNPKERKWAFDSDASFGMPSRQSLEGIYITTNLMTAISSAPIKEKLIVIAQVQPRALFADEDTVTGAVSGIPASDNAFFQERGIAQLYLALKTNTNQEYLNDVKQRYIEIGMRKLVSMLNFDIHSNLKQRLGEILNSLFYVALNRSAAYIDEDTVRDMKMYYNKLGNFEIPDKLQAENEYSKWMDKLTRTLKSAAHPDKRADNFQINGRLLAPIGYSGKNKILAIVKEVDRETEVVYGEVPDQFVKDWQSVRGEWRSQ